MIFPKLELDYIVAEADKFRLDASLSFVGSGEVITSVMITPDTVNNSGVSYNITDDMFLDYAFPTAGEYEITLLVTTDNGTASISEIVTVVDKATDNLQSSDSMLYAYESELKRYIPNGRNSWKYIHRLALSEIIDYLSRNGIRNPDGTSIEVSQLIGQKLEKWATFEALILIYQDIKTNNVELFNDKIDYYTELRGDARELYELTYDSDKDGDVDSEDAKTATRQRFFSR